jgi:dTDP-4-dehydrorhamnose 3,5-epimerase
MARFSSDIERKISTQSYETTPRIEGVRLLDLKRFRDEGGSMLELARFSEGSIEGLEDFVPRQMNYSTVEPGMIKAFHVHRKQTDVWFVPEHDRMMLILQDLREASSTEGNQMRFILGDGVSRLVRIPPGVAHGCRNMGRETARILYFTDLQFSTDAETCDEGRLPWDHFGAEIWEARRD